MIFLKRNYSALHWFLKENLHDVSTSEWVRTLECVRNSMPSIVVDLQDKYVKKVAWT